MTMSILMDIVNIVSLLYTINKTMENDKYDS